MSKLIDRLLKVNRSAPAPLGFARSAGERASPMLLLASLNTADLRSLSQVLETEPAAVLLEDANLSDKAVKALEQRSEEVPWGVVWDAGRSHTELTGLKKLGCDFIILEPQKAMATLLEEDDLGKVLLLDSSIKDILWPTTELLPLDAIAISPDVAGAVPFTVHSLMRIAAIKASIDKPVLLYVPNTFPPGDIRVLQDIEIEALVFPIGNPSSVEAFKALQEAAKGLSITRKKPKKGARALLPRITTPSREPKREEEEEEE